MNPTQNTDVISIEPDTRYDLDGYCYTGMQLQASLQACYLLSLVYALTDESNGGKGHGLNGDSLDAASIMADLAMENRMNQINADAKEENALR